MPASVPVTLAAFDVDHTLTRRDCVLPFLVRAAGRGRVTRTVAQNLIGIIAVGVGRGNRDQVKSAMVRGCLAGRALAELDHTGALLAAVIEQRWMRPDTLARLRWHQAQGHETALVSASLGPYLHPLGRSLGVTHVLCTELEAVSGGQASGNLLGGNCRGPAKVARLQAAYRVRPETVWAYGDSTGDREMLAWADRPLLVGKAEITAAPSTPVA